MGGLVWVCMLRRYAAGGVKEEEMLLGSGRRGVWWRRGAVGEEARVVGVEVVT